MRIVHIMGNDKFAQGYINLINKEFDCDNHLFLLLDFGSNVSYPRMDDLKNVMYISKSCSDLYKIVKYSKKAEKIIFHGLFSKLVMAIICIGGFSKKTYCALWGGDLYKYGKESKIEFGMKHHIISKSRGIVMELEDDYYLAQKWYGASCPYFNCMLYLSNIVDNDEKTYFVKQVDDPLVIQIGNSADPSNRHEIVLDELMKYKNENIRLLLPLSYGEKKYAEEIISYAKGIYGKKVEALKEFMPLEQYLRILDSVDVAIFAHKRQQGLGNILTLLSKGKKVYVPSEVTVFQSLSRLGIKIFDTNNIDDNIFEKLNEEDIKSNKEKVLQISNINKLISDWKAVFDD